MSGRIALLAGLYIVPLILLWLGHHFRKRSPRSRSIFWGSTIGYLIGVVVASVLMLAPPVDWAGGSALREVLVSWSMTGAALVGAAVGFMRAR